MAEMRVLDLGSDPLERGKVHGREMRTEIRENYATCIERFETGGAKHSDVLKQSQAWGPFIARDNPNLSGHFSALASICRHPDINALALYSTDRAPCQSNFQAVPVHVSVATNQWLDQSESTRRNDVAAWALAERCTVRRDVHF
jgi:hypothetical protein